MKCPFCAKTENSVLESRVVEDGRGVRRRRECEKCKKRFTTYEHAERHLPVVVKKDGRREPWNEDKIMQGLSKACEKRPISVEEIEQLTAGISDEVSALAESEISSQLIGERIMERLHDLDEVAYVRFASVYRQFKDIDEFMSELADLIREKKGSPTDSSP